MSVNEGLWIRQQKAWAVHYLARRFQIFRHLQAVYRNEEKIISTRVSKVFSDSKNSDVMSELTDWWSRLWQGLLFVLCSALVLSERRCYRGTPDSQWDVTSYQRGCTEWVLQNYPQASRLLFIYKKQSKTTTNNPSSLIRWSKMPAMDQIARKLSSLGGEPILWGIRLNTLAAMHLRYPIPE